MYVREHFQIAQNSRNLIDFFASDNVAKLKSTARLWLKEGTYLVNER